MLFWIAAVLALYLAQIYLSATLFLPAEGLVAHAGPRDSLPDRGKYAGRAERVLVNFKENLPFFLVPAVLALALPGTDLSAATLAAQIFLVARIFFAAFYMFGVPWARSLAYGVGLGANIYGFWALTGS
ncbi:MAPEG family protein [Labrenzia sp. CE80]|uniref:MAPEG family protein n=1 Tax=Labrenzia sp. CE80 TaxID=1788986 RepID=UPI00129B4615|nr:MAPEG family protein [Labrenzia sp. CE80]